MNRNEHYQRDNRRCVFPFPYLSFVFQINGLQYKASFHLIIQKRAHGFNCPQGTVSESIQQCPVIPGSRVSPYPLPERVNSKHYNRIAINQNEVLTGSHPFIAENPKVPHPGFEPDIMSLKPFAAVEYISGFRKPSGDLPLEIKRSFRREMTLAAVCHA